MALNDPYLPDPVNVSSGGNTTFDGSTAGTNTAYVLSLSGNFDAEIYLEAWDGSAWQEVTQLTDDAGNTTLSAGWHTQYNKIPVSTNARRIRIENVDTSSGWVAVEGDER
jgi:hypothetical protein